ncbi:hypothetical protein, partial [Ruegeria sp. HKCCA5763]|uniref:hypothetical protein n=1 Tax=Ruegeria sp. HKCCA5763 TaxID=2682987 RepID=UPI001C2C803D
MRRKLTLQIFKKGTKEIAFTNRQTCRVMARQTLGGAENRACEVVPRVFFFEISELLKEPSPAWVALNGSFGRLSPNVVRTFPDTNSSCSARQAHSKTHRDYSRSR